MTPGDADAVSPVLPEQGRSLYSSVLCLCGSSTFAACESLAVLCTKTVCTLKLKQQDIQLHFKTYKINSLYVVITELKKKKKTLYF